MIKFLRSNGYQGINAHQDSAVFHLAAGKSGVIKGVYDSFALSYDGAVLTIGAGQAIIQGRQFEIPAGFSETITLEVPASGTYYYTIYIKMDCTFPIAEAVTIEHLYNSSDYPAVPSSGDLFSGDTTVAYMLLAYVDVTTAGITAVTFKAPYVNEKLNISWDSNDDYPIIVPAIGDTDMSVELINDIIAEGQEIEIEWEPYNISSEEGIYGNAFIDRFKVKSISANNIIYFSRLHTLIETNNGSEIDYTPIFFNFYLKVKAINQIDFGGFSIIKYGRKIYETPGDDWYQDTEESSMSFETIAIYSIKVIGG